MRAMLPPLRRAALAAVLVVSAALLSAASSAPVYHDHDNWAADADYGYGGVATCAGTVVGPDCVVAARRELSYGGSIGNGALAKDQTPCSYPGASYYNCRPGGAANPYTRGCSAITQCRG